MQTGKIRRIRNKIVGLFSFIIKYSSKASFCIRKLKREFFRSLIIFAEQEK